MKYTEIIIEKINNNVYIAKTNIIEPVKCKFSIKGESESDAREKLINMLNEE